MNLKTTLDVWKNVASRNTYHAYREIVFCKQSIMHYYDHNTTRLSVYEIAIYQLAILHFYCVILTFRVGECIWDGVFIS